MRGPKAPPTDRTRAYPSSQGGTEWAHSVRLLTRVGTESAKMRP
jgi:hypothetical protein